MPCIRVSPVYEPRAHGALCVQQYPGHPRGCPNFGKKAGCPPAAPRLADFFDLSGPCYCIYNVFDLAGHVERMRAAHPTWSWRQLVNCLYWQRGARAQLEREIEIFIGEDLESFAASLWYIERCPEAMGLNVTQTLRNVGVEIEWPPERFALQVAFAAPRNTDYIPYG